MTAQLALKAGNQVQIADEVFIIEKVNGPQYFLVNQINNGMRIITHDEIVSEYFSGSLQVLNGDISASTKAPANDQFMKLFEEYPIEDRKRALRSHRYVEAVLKEMPGKLSNRHVDRISKALAQHSSDPIVPSARSIRRWVEKWKLSGGDIRSLLPNNQAKGNAKPRLDPNLVIMINEAIEETYLKREQNTVPAVLSALADKLVQWNEDSLPDERISLPNEQALYRAVRQRDPYTVAVAKHGKAKADRMFKPVFAMAVAERPMQVVQIDHAILNIMVKIDGSSKPFRPTITLLLDQYSRMVVGFYIGFDDPGTVPTMLALRNMIWPKDAALADYPDIKSPWPCYGRAEKILADNGPEFRGVSFRDACQSVGMRIEYCEPYAPWQKAHVERFFKTLNTRLIHQIPGTTFSNPEERGDYDSEAEAVLTLNELRRVVHRYIVDEYHNRVHRGIGTTPLNKWNSGVAKQPPCLPNISINDLNAVTAISTKKTRDVSRQGIHIHNVYYNSNELADLRKKTPGKLSVRVKFDPLDLNAVWVYDENNGRWIVVPSVIPTYTEGLSLYQHQAIRKEARKNDKAPSLESLFETRAAIFADIETAKARNQANTKRVAKFEGHGHPVKSSDGSKVSTEDAEASGEFSSVDAQFLLDDKDGQMHKAGSLESGTVSDEELDDWSNLYD